MLDLAPYGTRLPHRAIRRRKLQTSPSPPPPPALISAPCHHHPLSPAGSACPLPTETLPLRRMSRLTAPKSRSSVAYPMVSTRTHGARLVAVVLAAYLLQARALGHRRLMTAQRRAAHSTPPTQGQHQQRQAPTRQSTMLVLKSSLLLALAPPTTPTEPAPMERAKRQLHQHRHRLLVQLWFRKSPSASSEASRGCTSLRGVLGADRPAHPRST